MPEEGRGSQAVLGKLMVSMGKRKGDAIFKLKNKVEVCQDAILKLIIAECI